MKKYFSLIKASMSEGMNLFRINTKRKNFFTQIILPIIITLLMMGTMFSYSELIIKQLQGFKLEFVLLTLFIIFTSLLTIIEGIYKSGNLLFNCKDDNLLFSLPIKKRNILFVRLFKFYIFELIYNSMFLLPAIISYAIHVNPNYLYYIISFIGLLLFPIIPILISSIIGVLTTFVSSKFKGKNIVQTILTFILLLGILYISSNIDNILTDIAKNATSINNFITKIYYPAGAYLELINNFKLLKLIEFILINLLLFTVTILIIGKFYFNINSSTKSIKIKKENKQYIIKTNTPTKSLIKKEFNRFINSPVFVTNAGFGMILFIIGCIIFVIKFESLSNSILGMLPNITADYINSYLPIILFALICFASLMTSITSSMISLEGKSFNILKSLPVKPYNIIRAKILSALLIMIPCILLGDIIVFVKFKFDIISIILLLIASILFPLLTETIGIIINLKYPRMDAKNDTEVVKQSMSSAISVFIGMGLLGITAVLLFKAIEHNITSSIIMLIFISVYALIYALLSVLLHKTCEKLFNSIII